MQFTIFQAASLVTVCGDKILTFTENLLSFVAGPVKISNLASSRDAYPQTKIYPGMVVKCCVYKQKNKANPYPPCHLLLPYDLIFCGCGTAVSSPPLPAVPCGPQVKV